MNPIFSRSAVGAAILLSCGSAAAQSEPTLKEVTVTGNPLGSELIAPATQYSGPGLLLRSQTTLGETLNAFASRFRNYIALMSTGIARDAQGNGSGTGVTDCGDGTSAESGCAEELMPEFAYRQVRAKFRGLEAGGNVRLLDGASVLELELRGDIVRATNATTGEPLPRIAPMRAGTTLAWSRGPWGARLGFDHATRQHRVPAGELTTGAYTLWNAALTWRTKVGASNLLWYARLDNAANRLAYSATSILTQTAPGKAPLPGRSLKLGLQASF